MYVLAPGAPFLRSSFTAPRIHKRLPTFSQQHHPPLRMISIHDIIGYAPFPSSFPSSSFIYDVSW